MSGERISTKIDDVAIHRCKTIKVRFARVCVFCVLRVLDYKSACSSCEEPLVKTTSNSSPTL